jgi:hypothetical protein
VLHHVLCLCSFFCGRSNPLLRREEREGKDGVLKKHVCRVKRLGKDEGGLLERLL